MKTVLILAAENGALEGGKVGGIGDVIRDLPPALAQAGWRVIVLTPDYGANGESFEERETINSRFGNGPVTAKLFAAPTNTRAIENLVIQHPGLLGAKAGQVYVNDDASQPFATDATRFALFCSFAASWLQQQNDIDVVHLHDWHAAPFLLLREFSKDFEYLKDIRCVFTIHNLALQGIRPLRQHVSSLFEWFPDLLVDGRVVDPRWRDCINLMRTGMQLADKVSTVSSSYAREIQTADDPDTGRHGGEGLHGDAKERAANGELVGILNGCTYPADIPGKKMALSTLLRTVRSTVFRLAAQEKYARSDHLIALERITTMARRRQQVLVTSVGRLTRQKTGLLEFTLDDKPVLHHMLEVMGKNGILVMLGSGDSHIEAFLTETSARYENLLFIGGFDQDLSDHLFRSGNLFLMPSTFEPCGVSQMFAMRASQPCLVHQVGGLIDTVNDGVNGWGFAGDSRREQAINGLARFNDAFSAARDATDEYQTLCANAATTRFSWQAAAQSYISELYCA